ncbi:MAG: hypothetical protein DI582_03185 [Azospirillum brasilense]|nr:MAG: hypothetical protein DI582_03185 [Azospirillum brasilense]
MSENQHAFSLVELSIVLVILGLLTGGILGGQALIRAAELRAASTEYQRWVTATQTFRDKYFALPGDMTNATAFWGKDNTLCSGDSGTAATPGTCNGDGDGNMEVGSSTAGATGEVFRHWQQLALAGLVEGTYTGANGGDADTSTIGVNIPRSKISNAGWTLIRGDIVISGGSFFDGLNYPANVYFLGAQRTLEPTTNPILKAEEAWNLDTKMDDGKPGRGKVHGGRITSCTTAASSSDTGSDYQLTNSSANACTMIFFANF